MTDRRGRWRWLVTDLDGTLVDRDQSVPERNRLAVARFRASGGEVVIATGRNEESATRYHRLLGLNTPMILYNGARIVAADGSPCHELTLADAWPTLRERVVPVLPDTVGVVAFAGGVGYAVRQAPPLVEYARRNGIRLREGGAGLPGAVTKVMFIADHPTELDTGEDAARTVLGPADLVRSEPTYLEVLPRGANKGNALRRLATRSGVDLNRVAAIGDNPNDASMLAVAGLGVAVGDGDLVLRRGADLVVADCAAGAVGDLVDRLIGRADDETEASWEPQRNSAV